MKQFNCNWNCRVIDSITYTLIYIRPRALGWTVLHIRGVWGRIAVSPSPQRALGIVLEIWMLLVIIIYYSIITEYMKMKVQNKVQQNS